MSRHSSPTLCFSAGRSGVRSAASLTMSAIVCEPVLASAALTVPTSIFGVYLRLGLGGYCPALGVLQRLREERLVDPPLEDRHPELHALHDHFTPVHACLACQLRRGQMDRHVSVSSLAGCLPISFTPRSGRRNYFPAICIKWGWELR